MLRPVLLVALALAPAAARGAPASPFAAVESLTLDNGMRVLLYEDHSSPKVALITWIRVGSRDEETGRTGFAHLFEHLMFKGTPAIVDGRMDAILEAAGGFSSAFTTPDMTVYLEWAASNYLETVLWIEADRLATLVDQFDEKKLDNQREVVRNERRQSIDNTPYAKAYEVMTPALWPKGHGYSWMTIGSHEDLIAASVDDVTRFFRRWYVPANATMVLAGDFDRATAKTLITKYMGAIKKAPVPKRPTYPDPTPIAAPVRLSATDQVQVPRVYRAWRGPRAFAPDEPGTALAAQILAGGKSSRLYERLVYRERLAQDVDASFDEGDLGATITIYATAKPGITAEALSTAMHEEVARLAREAPAAEEVERARNLWEARFLGRIEGLVARAIQIAFYEVRQGKPDGLAADLARFRAVTSADVRQAAARWLSPTGFVEVTIMPEKRP